MNNSEMMANIGIIVALALSIGGFIRQWRIDQGVIAKAEREARREALAVTAEQKERDKERAEELAKLKHEIDLEWVQGYGQEIKNLRERLSLVERENRELRNTGRSEDQRRITELELHVAKQDERIATLEAENHRLRGDE